MSEPAPEVPAAPDPLEASVVPSCKVRNCMVRGKPAQGRECEYICRCCGTLIDCSDAC